MKIPFDILSKWASKICRWFIERCFADPIESLQEQHRLSSITTVLAFGGDVTVQNYNLHLDKAVAQDVGQNLKDTIRSLEQKPLSSGHTYASLPDGTNIVSLADGSFRLALPRQVSAQFHGGLDGELSATVKHQMSRR